MRKILMRIAGIALFLTSVGGLGAQNSTGATLPEKYRKWLKEDAGYIISSKEREVLLNLATDRERDLFIEYFWKQRDPTPGTEENEFKTEHLRRLNIANSRFSTESMPGWRTDWGRLYIILGDLWPSLRLFEGIKFEEPETVTSVSASYLHPMISASIEAEVDSARETSHLTKIFNLREVRMVTEGLLGWPGKWEGKRVDHTIELNGKTYLFSLIPKTPGSRLFGIIVFEQSVSDRKSILETEIVLPWDKVAVFGFQTDQGRTYFLSLRVPPSTGDAARIAGSEKAASGPISIQEQTAAGDVVKISGDTPPPRWKKHVAPEYPEAAKKAGVGGVVILNVRIDERGKVEAVSVIRSIPLLDQAAVDAVRKWTYEPFVLEGKARKAEFTVSIRFFGDGQSADISNIRIPADFKTNTVLIDEDIARRQLIKYVKPVYPGIARQARVEGFVVLGVRLDEKGLVESVIILRSIPLLDQSAIEAVRQWEYQPPVINGAPCKIAFVATILFKMI